MCKDKTRKINTSDLNHPPNTVGLYVRFQKLNQETLALIR